MLRKALVSSQSYKHPKFSISKEETCGCFKYGIEKLFVSTERNEKEQKVWW